MKFLLKNNASLAFLSLCALLFTYNTGTASKISTDNYFKIVTMQPVADDDTNDFSTHDSDNFEFSDIKVQTNELKDNAEQKKSQTLNISPKELKCLAQTIYFEAKSESYEGGVAVGNVVMNRVKSGKFPDTICGVMTQKSGKMCQFSFMCNGQINEAMNQGLWEKSQKIAMDVATGKAPKLSNGALFFHAKYAKLRLASNRYTAKIGQHYFYK